MFGSGRHGCRGGAWMRGLGLDFTNPVGTAWMRGWVWTLPILWEQCWTRFGCGWVRGVGRE